MSDRRAGEGVGKKCGVPGKPERDGEQQLVFTSEVWQRKPSCRSAAKQRDVKYQLYADYSYLPPRAGQEDGRKSVSQGKEKNVVHNVGEKYKNPGVFFQRLKSSDVT